MLDVRDLDIDASRQKLLDGVAAGAAATLVMSALVLAAPALGGVRLPVIAARALLGLRAHPGLAVAALLAHFGYGSLAGGLFSVGARAITVGRGVLFALGLWALAMTVYAPLCGLGFVASHVPALAALTIPLHLIYGVALGLLTPRGEIVEPIENGERAAELDLATSS